MEKNSDNQSGNTVTPGGRTWRKYNDLRLEMLARIVAGGEITGIYIEAMTLSGRGGSVEGWAVAKDSVNREPLPSWVAPYDLIHYILQVK